MTEKCSHTFILMAMHTASSQKLLVITVVVRIPATADFFSFITLLLMQKKNYFSVSQNIWAMSDQFRSQPVLPEVRQNINFQGNECWYSVIYLFFLYKLFLQQLDNKSRTEAFCNRDLLRYMNMKHVLVTVKKVGLNT